MIFGSQTSVFLVLGNTDMRKSIDGLALIVADHLHHDVFSGKMYVFCNRNRNILKILYYDINGFCMWQKRLDRQKFLWPKSEHDVFELDSQKLRWLLDGLNPFSMIAHKKLKFSQLS